MCGVMGWYESNVNSLKLRRDAANLIAFDISHMSPIYHSHHTQRTDAYAPALGKEWRGVGGARLDWFSDINSTVLYTPKRQCQARRHTGDILLQNTSFFKNRQPINRHHHYHHCHGTCNTRWACGGEIVVDVGGIVGQWGHMVNARAICMI